MIAFIEAQGSLLSMKVTGYKSRPNPHSHKRGIIRVFSQAARRRLMRFMARLKTRKIRATFITLTFTEIVSNERAKKVFKRFKMRLCREFHFASAVWRMEYQERSAIHFHLLVFNLPFWKQSKLQETWEACTEESCSIAHIKLVHGARSVMSYISKYIAKADDRTEIPSLEDVSYQHVSGDRLAGRFWGYINKELLPLGQKVLGVLTDRQTIKSLSSFVWALLNSDNPYNSISCHLFCDNARWLCERAVEEGGCWLDEWEFTVKDHTHHKERYSEYTEHFSELELSMKPVLSLGRLSMANAVRLVAPLTRDWIRRPILTLPARRIYPYFDEHGTIVTNG